jgi:Family of unknown function (DUF5670)
MTETLIVVLLLAWLLGMGLSYTFGGMIHLLLVMAIVTVLVKLVGGQNLLRG